MGNHSVKLLFKPSVVTGLFILIILLHSVIGILRGAVSTSVLFELILGIFISIFLYYFLSRDVEEDRLAKKIITACVYIALIGFIYDTIYL